MQVYKEPDEKKIDFKTLLKILKYASPFRLLLITAFILLLLNTGFELLRPFIIGYAIDGFISGYKSIMIQDINGKITINDSNYSRLNKEIDDNNTDCYGIVILKNNRYIFFNKLFYDEALLLSEQQNINKINEIGIFYSDTRNREIEGIILTRTDLKIMRKSDFNLLIFAAMIFLLIVALKFICSYFQNKILGVAGQKIIFNIRNDLFNKIISMPLSYYDKTPAGSLVTRATNDIEALNDMYTNILVNFLSNIAVMGGVIVILLRIDVQLALASLSVLPMIILATVLFRKFSVTNYRKMKKAVSSLNTFLSEHIQAMKIIRLFGISDRKFTEFKQTNAELNQTHLNEINIFGLFRPSIHLFYTISIIIVILYGGMKYDSGLITTGSIFMFLYSLGLFFFPINEIAERFGTLQSALTSAERIFAALNLTDESQIHKGTLKLPVFKGEIEFKNVWFSYKNDDWVLKDVSFKIQSNTRVAFVGATGSGKSTIISLITGFYKIKRGEILIDGINIDQVDLTSLRSLSGTVLQDLFLFNSTISNNISLFNDKIDHREIAKYAGFVNADSFINRLPEKYETHIAERGLNISNGERQLLSFARALCHKPQIIILDEATASIDSHTENLIRDAIDKMVKERTAIMIAHRLSTIKDADRIIVIHKGEIKESGTHKELMKNKSLYYNLYRSRQLEEVNL